MKRFGGVSMPLFASARPVAITSALALLGSVQTADAAGFYIKEQSVTGLGRAFAGESAVAEDASTIFFNPAGMTRLQGPEATAGVHLLVPRADLENRGSSSSVRTPAGAPTRPISGSDGGNPYDPTPVPNAYFAYPLMDRDLWVGLGVSAPFGLANKYDADWFGRYDSIETDLLTIDIAPSVAYKVLDWVSIGGGIDIQYADAKLTNAFFAGPATGHHFRRGRRRLGGRLQCRHPVRTAPDHAGRHPLPLPDRPYAGGRRQADPRRAPRSATCRVPPTSICPTSSPSGSPMT